MIKRFSLSPTNLFFHIVGNKGCEVEWGYHKEWNDYFCIYIDWTRRCDHAGFGLNLEMCGLSFDFDIYDYRHWNSNEKYWETYCTVCQYPLQDGNCTNHKCKKHTDKNMVSEEAWHYLMSTLKLSSIFNIDPRQMALLRKLVNDYPVVKELVDYHDRILSEEQ